jgi:hypothetical protein
MAMIQCPECGNQVSSAATACPNCGHPIQGPQQQRVPSAVGTGVGRGFGGCAGMLLFLIALMVLGAVLRECQG